MATNWLCSHGMHRWTNIWSYDKPKYVCARCGADRPLPARKSA
jgi:ribosomal protein L40E